MLQGQRLTWRRKPIPMRDATELKKRYPKVQVRDYRRRSNARSPKWMRWSAYLQVLGTMVDHKKAASQQAQ